MNDHDDFAAIQSMLTRQLALMREIRRDADMLGAFRKQAEETACFAEDLVRSRTSCLSGLKLVDGLCAPSFDVEAMRRTEDAFGKLQQVVKGLCTPELPELRVPAFGGELRRAEDAYSERMRELCSALSRGAEEQRDALIDAIAEAIVRKLREGGEARQSPHVRGFGG